MYTPLSISAFMSSAIFQYLFIGFFFLEIKLTYNEMCNCWVYMSFDKWLSLCSSNSYKDSEHNIISESSLVKSVFAPTLQRQQLFLVIFYCGLILSLLGLHIRGISQYSLFCIRLLSFRITSLRFTHAVGGVHNPFLFFDEYNSIAWL